MNQDSKLKVVGVGKRPEVGPEAIAANFLLEKVLREGKGCIYNTYFNGYTDKKFEEFITILEARGGRRFAQTFYEGTVSGNSIYIWDHGMVEITIGTTNQITVTMWSSDQEFLLSLRKEFKTNFSEPTKQGFIFAIMKGSSGALQLTRIGYAGTPLERRNYNKDVISDYDYVLKDLKSKDPSGRITILEGDPGTGKTYLVRSVLMDVPDAMFVLVPPTMVSSLGGPDLLPLLLRNKEDYGKKGPTVLVLEDADQCLVPRQGDNMSSISSILNLGDGIFGSLFDIRIVATTNARKAEMDPAIIRAGRLSKRIEVLPMNYDEANGIFQRLLPTATLPRIVEESSHSMRPTNSSKKSGYTLAEIYKAARDHGWEPTPKDKEVLDTATILADDDGEIAAYAG